MKRKSANPSGHPGRAGNPVSLGSLGPTEALAGLFKVKIADVKKLEAAEGKGKKLKAKKG